MNTDTTYDDFEEFMGAVAFGDEDISDVRIILDGGRVEARRFYGFDEEGRGVKEYVGNFSRDKVLKHLLENEGFNVQKA